MSCGIQVILHCPDEQRWYHGVALIVKRVWDSPRKDHSSGQWRKQTGAGGMCDITELKKLQLTAF